MHWFYQENIKKGDELVSINEIDARHIIKVLRFSIGDELLLFNGKGLLSQGEIKQIDKKTCVINIIKQTEELEKPFPHIAIAPTKNMDRIEWFVEKACEIGLKELSFVLTHHSERKKINLERIEKIVIAACKQSQKAYIPKVNDVTSFNEFCKNHKQAYFAHCQHTPKEKLTTLNYNPEFPILIGPEGDFSSSEIQVAEQKNYIPISLGEERLRTETAGLVACTIANLCV